MPVISSSHEAEIRRIMVQGQPLKLGAEEETSISTNKPGRGVHACYPSYCRIINWRIKVQGRPQAKSTRPKFMTGDIVNRKRDKGHHNSLQRSQLKQAKGRTVG
jgi:hypothetical protein